MLRRNNKSIKIPFFSSRDLRATCNYTQTDFTANPGGGGATQPTNEHTWPSKSNGALSKTHFCHHALLSHIPTEQTKVSHHWLRGGSSLYDDLGLCFILFSRFSWSVSEGQEVSISRHRYIWQCVSKLSIDWKPHKEGGAFNNCYHKQAHHI